jgi:hypothetical protein
MHSLSLRLGLACSFALQLAGCASQPTTVSRDLPPVDPAPPVVDEPAAQPPSPPPPAKKDPTPPPTVRNEGFGPYDSLERLCGTGQGALCLASAPVRTKGSSVVLAVAQFKATRMDGSASLAFETRDGWYVSEPPHEPFGGGLSHHTPAGADFLLDQVEVKGDEVVLVKYSGSASYIPGRGSQGSTSSTTYERLRCGVSDQKVVCGPPVVVYSEQCKDDKCKSTGVKPRT